MVIFIKYKDYPKFSQLVGCTPHQHPSTLFTPLTAGLSSAPSLLATQYTFFIREGGLIHATALRNGVLDGWYFLYVFFMFDDPVPTFRHTISVLFSESFDFTEPSYNLYAELVECALFLDLKIVFLQRHRTGSSSLPTAPRAHVEVAALRKQRAAKATCGDDWAGRLACGSNYTTDNYRPISSPSRFFSFHISQAKVRFPPVSYLYFILLKQSVETRKRYILLVGLKNMYIRKFFLI